jgi:hypothetical protein
MSSLVFYTQPDQAFIATDTLAVHPSGAPSHFTSKAVLVPHLGMVIAGTGVAGFSSRWFCHVNDCMTVRGIEHLDHHAQGSLQSLWSRYREEIGFPAEVTTTIYHFGISEVSGEVAAFAYRSENDFQSHRLTHGMKVKPACEMPADYELPGGIVQIMESQRRHQATVPAHERLYIGGEIQLFMLSKQGTACARLHRFDDFEEHEDAMYRNFRPAE